jgi:phosphoglycerate dehydrogenase-like enzyme
MASPLAPSPAAPLRIPVVSYLAGLGDVVRAKLRAGTTPASDLFRANSIDLVDVPLPPKAEGETWQLSDDQLDVLAQATVVLGDAHTLAPVVVTPESVLLPAHASDHTLLRNVQWMQATYAGVEHFQKRAAASNGSVPSFQLTRAGGVMPRSMAQYVFGWVIAIERKFFEARALQEQKDWNQAAMAYRHFSEVTIGILGLGDIGREIGRLLKIAGFQVIGFKRHVSESDAPSDDCADRVTNDLTHVLAQSDYLVGVLPSTAATRGLLNETNLVHCAEKKPVLINVGRGDLVTESTLLTALDSGWLSRAVLDVAPVEPLPASSPLWSHPRVAITPHVSAKSFPQEIADVFLDNLNCFLQQALLRYTVDWGHGY